jgi:DNA glycosylase AlkZ-like
MKPFDISQQRLHNQRLMRTPFVQPAEAVAWLGAVQAQEYPGAKWGLAQRTSGLSDAAIDQAFATGTILRTHALRPTWHFVAPADIRWILKLTAPRVHALNAYYYRKLELDDSTLARSNAALAAAVQGDKQLTRVELASALQQAGITRVTDDRLRLSYLMMYAELEGVLCSGAMRGKQHTYGLLDERVPPTRTLARDEALAELTRRYFTSHGPATVQDFTWWSGLSTADVKVGLEMNGSHLETAVVDGKTYWFTPNVPPTPATSPMAHLLPAYDEYTIAYKDHAIFLNSDDTQRVIAGYGIVIVIDGQIVGTWKRVVTKDRVLLTLSPFATLTEAENQAVARAVQRYSTFLGKPVVLV